MFYLCAGTGSFFDVMKFEYEFIRNRELRNIFKIKICRVLTFKKSSKAVFQFHAQKSYQVARVKSSKKKSIS